MKKLVGTPRRGVRFFFLRRATPSKRRTAQRAVPTILIAAISLLMTRGIFAQADPASEPAVLAVAKVLPAVVNINVGSLRGTNGLDGRTAWPFLRKYSRNVRRMSLTLAMMQSL